MQCKLSDCRLFLGGVLVRVIAGDARGHKLQTIEGLSTRPTTDRTKESLFSMISFDLPGSSFLDLFAGSGAIGIEALSRGAEKAVFIESFPPCVQVIFNNLNHTRLVHRGEVMKEDVFSGLKKLSEKGQAFDIIFLDPPYDKGLAEPVLKAIVDGRLLNKDGYIIVEHSSKIPLSIVEGLQVTREKVYRTTAMTFLSLEETKC